MINYILIFLIDIIFKLIILKFYFKTLNYFYLIRVRLGFLNPSRMPEITIPT